MKPLLIAVCATFMLSACSININKPKSPEQHVDSAASKVELQDSSAVFIKAIKLANGYSVIVEEGRLEPRSIGSITAKLYRDLNVGDFAGAVSFVRDGTIIKTELIENSKEKQKLAITTVTAGSGNYQNTQLLCIKAANITLC
ncbi:PliI family lysozyme inhibitor of I-type lysozyme [Shewanella halifaxensis]|uniref:PliI family lysozyme inhibitor of I-type lysozyme n=1 Tax=Shewanella halifaxensis TaxID=271098 RepID=UPI000D59F03E|nr:PliI family lysozyme inhibitor of I-type lysozyme [Shewanella halifaxensis]